VKKKIFFLLGAVFICMYAIGSNGVIREKELLDVSFDALCLITSYCDLKDIGNVRLVCKKWSTHDISLLICPTHDQKNHICPSVIFSRDGIYDQCSQLLGYYAQCIQNNASDVGQLNKNKIMFERFYRLHEEKRDEELKKIYTCMPKSLTAEDRITGYCGSYINNDLVEKAVQQVTEEEIRRQKKLRGNIFYVENIAIRNKLMLPDELKFDDNLFSFLTKDVNDNDKVIINLRKKFAHEIQVYAIGHFQRYREIDFEAVKRKAECLIAMGVDINQCCGFHADISLFQQFCEYDSCFELMKLLVEKGVDVNHAFKGKTPLYYAFAAAKNFEYLLDKGAHINGLSDKDIDWCLKIACKNNNLKGVNYLINKEVQINRYLYEYSGQTSLIIACRGGYVDIAQALIKAGACVIDNYWCANTSLDLMKRKEEFKHLVNSLSIFYRYYPTRDWRRNFFFGLGILIFLGISSGILYLGCYLIDMFAASHPAGVPIS